MTNTALATTTGKSQSVNPLFANLPSQEANEVSPIEKFFSDVPTSSDFMEQGGERYEQKRSHFKHSKTPQNALILADSTHSTPNQKRVEQMLIKSGASEEEIEEYLAYKHQPREEIIERTPALMTALRIDPNDEPIVEDFLLMAHRNNLGYMLAVPKPNGGTTTITHL